MPVDPEGRFFDGGRPIRVDGGLAVRARRGRIGQRWWSRRFVDVLEGICDGGRLARGRTYARKGQVLGFDLTPGLVTGQVQGSRPEPYEVTVAIDAYDEVTWARLTRALAGQALYRAALLAGEMPPEIEAAFGELGVALFPDRLDMRCSCPDWQVPCKHLSAVLYVLAEAFDDDPFLVLAWRGRDRAGLLDDLRAAPAPPTRPDPLAVPDEPLEHRLADFYAPGVPLSRLRDRPRRLAAPPDLLLRVLDPPPLTVDGQPWGYLLRRAYRALAEDPQT